jgi:hypothetical protein
MDAEPDTDGGKKMTIFSALLTGVLAASPISIARPGVSCIHLEQHVCDAYGDRLATKLSERGAIRVVTKRDVSQLLGLERQKQRCSTCHLNLKPGPTYMAFDHTQLTDASGTQDCAACHLLPAAGTTPGWR